MSAATLTLPTFDEVSSWNGEMRWQFKESPHDSKRWMVKQPFCTGEQGGAHRELEVANALREMGYLAYPVLVEETDAQHPKVALMHAEDANPGWKMLGTFSTAEPSKMLASATPWLEYAAISVAFGIGDRHYGNVLLMEHEDTGELRACSIDHECMCLNRECRPNVYNRPSGITHAAFLRSLSQVVESAHRTHHARLLNDATLAAALNPRYLQFDS